MFLTKKEAIKRFGSYFEVTVGPYSHISQFLGDHKDASYVQGTHEWIFPDTEKGLDKAKEWALSRRITHLTHNRTGIASRNARANTATLKIKLFFERLTGGSKLRTIVDEFNAKTEEMQTKHDVDNVENVIVVYVPDMIDLGGPLMEIGDKFYSLEVNSLGGNFGEKPIMCFKEYEIVSYTVYDIRPNGRINLHMNYNQINEDKTAKTISGSITPHAILDDGEIKAAFAGHRYFLTKEAARSAGETFAKNIIATLEEECKK